MVNLWSRCDLTAQPKRLARIAGERRAGDPESRQRAIENRPKER